ncbi:hypothetical protein BRC92_04685 [Halobacteriales archaeon QS_4_69_31]|nr:MAG: hypothetical protein BRC92_04685 [Halobacteriales archaeon QS_4_69_31]
MRRDHVTLTVRHADPDADRLPTVVLTVEESADQLADRLVTVDRDSLGADDVDVAFRLQDPVDADGATGVFSLSNRVTGAFLLEVNTDADALLDIARTAREDDADASYRVLVQQDGQEVAVYEKQTLLVYDDEGSLLRQHSLIPSGVEL